MPSNLPTPLTSALVAIVLTCSGLPPAHAAGAPEKKIPDAPPGYINFASSIGYKGELVTLVGKLEVPEDPEDEYRKFPLIVMLHGCIGLNKYTKKGLEAHAEAFKKAGFASLVIDSFGPRKINLGWTCKKLGRRANAQGFRKSDVKDALDHLKEHEKIDIKNAFVLGQGNGGNTAAFLSRIGKTGGIRAVAAYYPLCDTISTHSPTPLLVLIGDKDEWMSHEACKKAESKGYGMKLVSYEGAHHLFDLPVRLAKYQKKIVGGDKRATRDSRNQIIEFFTKRIVKDEDEEDS